MWWERGIVEIGREALMKDLGVYLAGPSLFTHGAYVLLNKPFTDLASVEGRKIRAMGGILAEVLGEAMGLSQTMIARGEVPTALQLGTIPLFLAGALFIYLKTRASSRSCPS